MPTTLVEDHPVAAAAAACKRIIASAGYATKRFELNSDGALMFAVASDFPEQGRYLDCLFDELGTTEIIRNNVWSATGERQSEEHDGVEYQYSVQVNQYGGEELVVAIQEIS